MEKRLIPALFLMLSVPLSACSSHKKEAEEPPLEAAATALATESKLDIEKTPAGNAQIDLKLRHLAPPEKIQPNAKAYVVWATPTESSTGPTMNLGTLRPNDNLEAQIKTVTPYREFKLLITPEADKTALAPTSSPVLWTNEISL